MEETEHGKARPSPPRAAWVVVVVLIILLAGSGAWVRLTLDYFVGLEDPEVSLAMRSSPEDEAAASRVNSRAFGFPCCVQFGSVVAACILLVRYRGGLVWWLACMAVIALSFGLIWDGRIQWARYFID